MKIAFIHYHLKTGGVTTVLRQQIEAIRGDHETLVLTGSPPPSPFPTETVTIPDLGYDQHRNLTASPDSVADAVRHAMFSRWKSGCDLLHVHNPLLAKNRDFLKILKALSQKNIKLFLQIHDFAEDGRPGFYFEDEYLPDCHYGVINSRDYHILLKAGLKKQGLHKIPNMIHPFILKSDVGVAGQHILYPVRAIRRKNVGEAILLTLFMNDGLPLLITLPPNSPMDVAAYEGWKTFVGRYGLKVRFDAGLESNFEKLMRASRFLITTSISEGFGFSFLEPWLAHKLLWGRKIPEICQDFQKKHIRLNHLYRHLMIPVDWIGSEALFQRQMSTVLDNCRLYDFPFDEEKTGAALRRLQHRGVIDFGLLDEHCQKKAIIRIISNPSDKARMIRLNPFLKNSPGLINQDRLISDNRTAILTHYNEAQYTKNLRKVYARVSKTDVHHRIRKSVLFSEFFKLESFSLLNWGDYVE